MTTPKKQLMTTDTSDYLQLLALCLHHHHHPSVPVAPVQPLSQADATVKELRTRMGDDVGLLDNLPHEKRRTAPFDNKAEPGGNPLPIRILFRETEQDNSSSMGVWALLHNKPGSSRTSGAQTRGVSVNCTARRPYHAGRRHRKGFANASFHLPRIAAWALGQRASQLGLTLLFHPAEAAASIPMSNQRCLPL
jgi:hypothetical protein